MSSSQMTGTQRTAAHKPLCCSCSTFSTCACNCNTAVCAPLFAVSPSSEKMTLGRPPTVCPTRVCSGTSLRSCAATCASLSLVSPPKVCTYLSYCSLLRGWNNNPYGAGTSSPLSLHILSKDASAIIRMYRSYFAYVSIGTVIFRRCTTVAKSAGA